MARRCAFEGMTLGLFLYAVMLQPTGVMGISPVAAISYVMNTATIAFSRAMCYFTGNNAGTKKKGMKTTKEEECKELPEPAHYIPILKEDWNRLAGPAVTNKIYNIAKMLDLTSFKEKSREREYQMIDLQDLVSLCVTLGCAITAVICSLACGCYFCIRLHVCEIRLHLATKGKAQESLTAEKEDEVVNKLPTGAVNKEAKPAVTTVPEEKGVDDEGNNNTQEEEEMPPLMPIDEAARGAGPTPFKGACHPCEQAGHQKGPDRIQWTNQPPQKPRRSTSRETTFKNRLGPLNRERSLTREDQEKGTWLSTKH